MPALQNGIVGGAHTPFGLTSLPKYSFTLFLLIQLDDAIPAWPRYPDLRPLAHLLKAV
jgi:hypothetical protein